MRIKAMIFDLWGTLIEDGAHGEGEARQRARVEMTRDGLAALGHRYDQGRIAAAFEAAGDELSNVHAEGLDLSTEGRTVLYLRHLDETLPDRLDDAGWRTMHEAILTPARSVRPPMVDGAAQALASMRDLGLSVGLISNAGITPGFVLREILRGYGLLSAFDHTIFSDEVEISKPSAAIFEHALECFGAEPSEAAFIGDQPVLDVLGPQAAGLWTIQVGGLTADGITPHARIAELADLLPALRGLGLV